MFSASQLNDDQKKALEKWAAEGASIADLQKRLKEEYGIGMTYMDARFLVLDLGIQIRPAEEDERKDLPAPEEAIPQATGGVSVTVDSIAVPGAMISGKVTFSDGQGGVWMLDQYGRPGLDMDTAGYRPSEEDIAEFQKQLSDVIRDKGF